LLSEEDEALARAVRSDYTLLEEELPEPGLIPGIKGGFLETLEGFLGLVVFVLGPGRAGSGDRIPV